MAENIASDPASHDLDSEIVQTNAQGETNRLIAIACVTVMLSYLVGLFQITSIIPIMFCVYLFWLTKDKVSTIYNCLNEEHERREHTRRALEHAETVEWFNTLLNRWWCFSSNTIEQLMKKTLDPLFEGCKPKIIENIELQNFTLGTRTPFLRYVKVYEMTDDMRKEMASDISCRNPPPDLKVRQKYQIAVDADMGLDAPQSQLSIRVKLRGKLGFTDVNVEQFKLRGRLQLILFFNENIPFPHLAAFSFTFVSPPKVTFEIKLLKSIKLMEFPVIRNWIEELVNDSLKISLVDPGHVTIPLCNDPEILGRQVGYASGVLTLTIKGGTHGKAISDEQWCSITLDKQKIRTKEITSDVQWKEEVSLLVRSLQFDKLKIKIKGKRRFGPNYTVVEYVLPLIRLNLEQDCDQEMVLQDETIEGSDLHVALNYFSLPVLDLSNETDEQTFQTNYIEKNAEKEPDEVSGVLFVRVHKGIGLIPMDSSGTSDPYLMIFNNAEFIHLGHVVEENLNPEWDTMTEFFTLDYTQTTLSFIIHDRDNPMLPNVLLADEGDDFMGSCNLALTKSDWCVFKRPIDVHYKIHGDVKKGLNETMKKVGKIVVSVIFRPVSSIKNSVRGVKNASMPEGEPIYQKRTKIDAVTMEAMLCSERGSLTICILRARNLMALDMNGRSDPFVSIRVGNSKQEKYKSKVVYRTLNPVWNEQVTLAMPQKHEKVTIEVYDKDPFTQEKMGVIRFDYKQLLELGEGDLNEKHWFDLEEAKSGELQLAFKCVSPESNKSDEEVGGSVKQAVSTYSIANDSENSDDEEYLVLEDGKQPDGLSVKSHNEDLKVHPSDMMRKQMSVPAKLSNGHNSNGEGNNNVLCRNLDSRSFASSAILQMARSDSKKSAKDTSGKRKSGPAKLQKEPNVAEDDENVMILNDNDDDVVDFSGEPQKYFGIYGKIIELSGLVIHEDIDEIYVKAKLDRHAKFHQPSRRSILNRNQEKILCKSRYLSVDQRITINQEFEMKSDIGVSPGIYLIIEVKSDKKGKDIIDSHSTILRSIFRGETSVVRVIELDNGGKIKIQMGHTTPENNTVSKRPFTKLNKRATSVT